MGDTASLVSILCNSPALCSAICDRPALLCEDISMSLLLHHVNSFMPPTPCFCLRYHLATVETSSKAMCNAQLVKSAPLCAYHTAVSKKLEVLARDLHEN